MARRWIPPQHGAWAMLLVPYLAGALHGWSWEAALLLPAWLAGWLASYFALLAVKTGRWSRYRQQIAAYGAACAATGIPAIIAVPSLLWWSPAFAALLGINLLEARRGHERDTGNGIASATMTSLMAMIVPQATGGDPLAGAAAALACWLYLAGTVLYVKTMIRERGSRAHLIASIVFHAAAMLIAGLVNPLLVPLFALLAGRAALLPRWRLRPAVVGVAEIAASALLLASLALLGV